jgi:hypothetical protein
MVCLCGHTISRHLELLLNHDSRRVSFQNWQQFHTVKLNSEISKYKTFRSMVDLLLRVESRAAVTLLRSHFVGHFDLVKVAGDDVKRANFLTSEGVLLRPDIAEPCFRMASPLLDGLIRDHVIHTTFRNAPSVVPSTRDNDAALNALDVLKESVRFFDKDLIRLAEYRSHKKASVKVPGSIDVPRESVYDTELMRILSNWLQGQYGWTVTGQWHLNNNLKEHKYPDIVIKKSNHLTVVLELLATGDRHSVQSLIEKTPEYMDLLSADEAWVVHFTCQDPYPPVWESPTGLGRWVNVVRFAHDLAFTKVLMSACWQDHAGNIKQVIDIPIIL